MKNTILKLGSLLLIVQLGLLATAQANEKLDALLNKVMQERTEESALWQEREAEFNKEKSKQAALVAQARKELQQVQAVGDRLNKTYEANEKKLTALEENKNMVMGAFGELYGVVRQMAADFFAQIENSPTTAQKQERVKQISALSQTKTLPTYEQLEGFWYLLQEEMTMQAQSPSFTASVINAKGESESREVTRVGAFNLFAGKQFVDFEGSSNSLEVYPRQPERRYTKTLSAFAKGSVGEVSLVSIDPSRGALLETLIQAPSLSERFHQGGIIGYVIFVLLLIGLVVTAERLYFYTKQERLMKQQLANMSQPDPNNPLGALVKTFNQYKSAEDSDVVALKLSEVILHQKPKFQRGLSTIKTFAGVAPLLGLLGTVTGMILTFQSITMFGSGDPKLMAGGISQALVTTVEGLICAIPLLIAYSYVNGKYGKIMTFLNEQLAGLLAEMEEGKQ